MGKLQFAPTQTQKGNFVMKKLILILSTLAITTPALAQNLPFVGKRVFTFEYNKDKEIITIAKNGQTKIVTSKTHWLGANKVLYQGKYQSKLHINHPKMMGYYQISGNQICLYEPNGQLFEDGDACTILTRK